MPTSKSEYVTYLNGLAGRRKERQKRREVDSYHASMSSKDKDALVSRSHRSFFQLFRAFWKMLAGHYDKVILGLVTLTISTALSIWSE